MSNEYDSVWAYTWGKVRPRLADASNEIAAVGSPMSVIPYQSRLWTAATNGARFITWENFALGRLPTNSQLSTFNSQLISAQIEFRSTGDFILRSNEVETVCRHIDDFDWDGDGIVNEEDWEPYFHNGDCLGQESWWREYVDDMVGVGLQNGYYKLTVTVPLEGFRRTAITVGDETVVADRPGEYVFLMEKGVDYELNMVPFLPGADFDVVDDLPALPRVLHSSSRWQDWTSWSMDGGNLIFWRPTFLGQGFCRWMPMLYVTPEISHLGPDDSPETYTANLRDFAYGRSVEYCWSSDDWNVCFGLPYSQSTTIGVSDMPAWGETDIMGEVWIGTNRLCSSCHLTYGTHTQPEVRIDISAPSALLLNSNQVDTAKIGQVYVSAIPDADTNGILRLYVSSGCDKVRLSGITSCRLPDESSLCVCIEGVQTSESLDDVSLCAEFVPDDEGEIALATVALSVIEVDDISLPEAPNSGLIVLTNTAVAFDLEVKPSAAKELISTSYKVRRLKSDGLYTEWVAAGQNYRGTAISYFPGSGGVYQVQAKAGVDWGAEDERYYVWATDESRPYGFHKRGDRKAFGVVNHAWQIALRGQAMSYLGSEAYLSSSMLPEKDGFPLYQPGAFKCNIFVAHCIVEAGLTVPKFRGLSKKYPPLANDWGSTSCLIDYWGLVDTGAFPQPGFVVADPNNDGSGHMGIIDFDGQAISAGINCVNRFMEGASAGLIMRDYRRSK